MKTRIKIHVLAAGALFLLAAASGSLAQDSLSQEGPGFKIVVNAANPTTEMPAKAISKLFKKIIVRWEDWEEDGDKVRVVPADQQVQSEVCKAFSRAVHGTSASATESYWQRMIFSGSKAPTPRLLSDEEVLDFVRRERGTIGYVRRDAELGEGVKELKISG